MRGRDEWLVIGSKAQRKKQRKEKEKQRNESWAWIQMRKGERIRDANDVIGL